MSAGTRSRAMTATAPESSAILAWSAVTTSMMTPPLSISAMPRLTLPVPVDVPVGEPAAGAVSAGAVVSSGVTVQPRLEGSGDSRHSTAERRPASKPRLSGSRSAAGLPPLAVKRLVVDVLDVGNHAAPVVGLRSRLAVRTQAAGQLGTREDVDHGRRRSGGVAGGEQPTRPAALEH